MIVYRTGYREASFAAVIRAVATLFSMGLCSRCLLVLQFHPLGLAGVIGFGTFLLTVAGREEEVVPSRATPAAGPR